MKNEKEKTKTEQSKGPAETAEDAYLSYPYRFWIQDVETPDEKELGKTKAEIEQKFVDLLKGINEETLQLSESLIEEKRLAHELCDLLKHILSHFKMSVTIPPKAVPFFKKTREIILNAQGNLILVDDEGRVDSRLLEDYPTDIILMVAWSFIPQLKKSISLYRKQVSQRVNFFNKINRELNNVNEVFLTSRKEPKERDLEEFFQEDVIKRIFREPEVKKPIRKFKAKKPIQEERIKKPIKEDEAKQPSKEKKPKKPRQKEKVKKPSREEGVKKPPVQEVEAKQPIQQAEVKEPIQQERPEKPIQEEKPKEPPRQERPKKPIQEEGVRKLFREEGVRKFMDYYKKTKAKRRTE